MKTTCSMATSSGLWLPSTLSPASSRPFRTPPATGRGVADTCRRTCASSGKSSLPRAAPGRMRTSAASREWAGPCAISCARGSGSRASKCTPNGTTRFPASSQAYRELLAFNLQEGGVFRSEPERGRRRGEEPYSRTATTPDGGIAKGSAERHRPPLADLDDDAHHPSGRGPAERPPERHLDGGRSRSDGGESEHVELRCAGRVRRELSRSFSLLRERDGVDLGGQPRVSGAPATGELEGHRAAARNIERLAVVLQADHGLGSGRGGVGRRCRRGSSRCAAGAAGKRGRRRGDGGGRIAVAGAVAGKHRKRGPS